MSGLLGQEDATQVGQTGNTSSKPAYVALIFL